MRAWAAGARSRLSAIFCRFGMPCLPCSECFAVALERVVINIVNAADAPLPTAFVRLGLRGRRWPRVQWVKGFAILGHGALG